MEITLSDATKLVNQVQTAHRLSVGFYQRLLPLLAEVADKLELGFWNWCPTHTDRPSQGSKSPADKWAWDLVPMFASRHDFRTEMTEHANVGDLAAVFKIYVDDNFKPERRKELGIKGEPDPLKMPFGQAIVEIDLFWCEGESRRSYDALWEDAEWPSSDNSQWESVGELMSARKLTFSLAQVIAEPDAVVSTIRDELAAAPRNA